MKVTVPSETTNSSFTYELAIVEFLEGTRILYKSNLEEPVAIRRMQPLSSSDTSAYSRMNEDPRVIRGLSGYSTTSDVDEETHQGEDLETENMAAAIQLVIVGDTGVPEKYKGEVLGWVEFLKQDKDIYKDGAGYFDFGTDTLILNVVYSKVFKHWNESLNTPEMVGDLPTKRNSPMTYYALQNRKLPNRKDINFARDIGSNNGDQSDEELRGIMFSGVKQAMSLVVEMENRFSKQSAEATISPRKIVFVAEVLHDNLSSASLLTKIGYKKHEKQLEEDGEINDIYYYEA